MPLIPEPDLNLLNGAISIAVTTIALLIYYLAARSKQVGLRLLQNFKKEAVSVRKVLLYRLAGALLFGLIPILVILLVFKMPLSNYGSNTDNLSKSIMWWIPVGMLLIVFTYFSSRKKDSLAIYPEIRVNQWNSGLIMLSALSYVTYLAGYEFMFRGFLLFSCLEAFGFWPAIIINIIIYAMIHLPKGPRETIGSLFLGLLLCLITIRLGSFWFAFLVHVTMALSNEWFSIANQPDMTVIIKRASR
jgi:membrane protease YdiL (CAAX protease family)